MASVSIKVLTLTSRLAGTGYKYAAKALHNNPVPPATPSTAAISDAGASDGTGSPSSSLSSSSSTSKPRRGLLSKMKRVFKKSKKASRGMAAENEAQPVDVITGGPAQQPPMRKHATPTTVCRCGDSTFITKSPSPDKNGSHEGPSQATSVNKRDKPPADKKDSIIESLSIELKECIQLRKKRELEHEATIAALKAQHSQSLAERNTALLSAQQHAQDLTEKKTAAITDLNRQPRSPDQIPRNETRAVQAKQRFFTQHGPILLRGPQENLPAASDPARQERGSESPARGIDYLEWILAFGAREVCLGCCA
ncbi:MAG: hypothetical protein Q9191_001842 [Dirinaria sp. TL-2023a]